MMLSERIEARRCELGLSRSQLAAAMTNGGRDTREADIWRWESGRNAPNLDALNDLARALETTIDFLVNGEAPASKAERAAV